MATVEYEVMELFLRRDLTRAGVKAVLLEHIEYGRWHHWRTAVYSGGHRRVWLRRRIIRVERTHRESADLASA